MADITLRELLKLRLSETGRRNFNVYRFCSLLTLKTSGTAYLMNEDARLSTLNLNQLKKLTTVPSICADEKLLGG